MRMEQSFGKPQVLKNMFYLAFFMKWDPIIDSLANYEAQIKFTI
jgi:hypothetical protein